MAKNTPVTKQELKERQKRIDARNRHRALVERKDVAMSNLRNRASILAGDYDDDYSQQQGNGYNDRQSGSQGVDRRFATDIQNAKFCRKPIGFLMSLFFLVCIALVALPFIPMQLPAAVSQYSSLFAETEAKQTAATDEDSEEDGEDEGDEEAAEAAAYADDAEDSEDADQEDED